MRAYQTNISTVIAFVSQLEAPPENWSDVERQACRLLFRGPQGWMVPSCLRAATHLGFPGELPELPATAAAAKCRVAAWEAFRTGGLFISERAARLRQSIDNSEFLGRRIEWGSWISASYVLQLEAAVARLQSVAPTRSSSQSPSSYKPSTTRRTRVDTGHSRRPL